MRFDEEKFEKITMRILDSDEMKEMNEEIGELEFGDKRKKYAVVPTNFVELFQELLEKAVKEYVESVD